MSEFDDVNRYFESMRHVFYSLLAIADRARGREPRSRYRPFDEDPDFFFGDAFRALRDADVVVQDKQLLTGAVAIGKEFAAVMEQLGEEATRFDFMRDFEQFLDKHRQAGMDISDPPRQ